MRRLINEENDFAELAGLAMEQSIVRGHNKEILECNFEIIDDTFVKENGKLKPYNENRQVIYLNHPLKLMASSKNEKIKELIGHDLVKQFIESRKNKGSILHSNAFDLIVFTIFIVAYSLIFILSKQWHEIVDSSTENVTVVENKTFFDNLKHLYPLSNVPIQLDWFFFVVVILIFVALVATLILVVKEGWQMYSFGMRMYCSVENAIQLAICILSFITLGWRGACLFPGTEGLWEWIEKLGIDPVAVQQLLWISSAITFVLAWCNMLILFAKVKEIGQFALMFKSVARSFRGAWIFVFFIFAFSFGFFILLQDKPGFHRWHHSVFRTLVMGTGEMDYASLFHPDPKNVTLTRPLLTNAAYLLYMVFVLVIVLLVMNLLTGVAVGEIQDLKSFAEHEADAIEVDTILLSLRFLSDDDLKSLPSTYRPKPQNGVPQNGVPQNGVSQNGVPQAGQQQQQQDFEKFSSPLGQEETLLDLRRMFGQFQKQMKYFDEKLKTQTAELENEQKRCQDQQTELLKALPAINAQLELLAEQGNRQAELLKALPAIDAQLELLAEQGKRQAEHIVLLAQLLLKPNQFEEFKEKAMI